MVSFCYGVNSGLLISISVKDNPLGAHLSLFWGTEAAWTLMWAGV